jgi:hypothetical protein
LGRGIQVSAFISKIEIQAVKGCVLISEAFIVIKSNQLKERTNEKVFFVTLSALMVLSTFFAGSVSTAEAKGPKVLKFNSMVGIPVGLTGAQSVVPLRGINGGGVPWTIADASGELRANGHLEISVQGLVLATTGSNPSQTFRGLVSCVRSDGTFANIPTDAFPATTGPASAGGGNAEIVADITLPQPCIAPIIFVTSGGGNWFAAIGL